MKQFFNLLAIGVLILAIVIFGDREMADDHQSSVNSSGGVLKFAIKANGALKIERKLKSENFITITQTSLSEQVTLITVTINYVIDSYCETIKFGDRMELNLINNYMQTNRCYISLYGQFATNSDHYGFTDKYTVHPLIIGHFDRFGNAQAEFFDLNIK